MASETVVLTDPETVADLGTFLARARSIDDGAVLAQASGNVLALYVPVLFPENLGDAVPTILGMRAVALGGPARAEGVYPISAMTERLARLGAGSLDLVMPPVEVGASWAGRQVPRGGWERLAEIPDDVLLERAAEGMGAVAQALPENAGKPVLATVRSRIWATPMRDMEVSMPLGMAFGAQALGFLRPGATSVLFGSGGWLRLGSTGGNIVARQGGVLG
ncbi:hypothetical protein ACSYDW_01145 [Paeniglutamicibacter sp. R2-26]|uniref:hypothetical protein n=1 Tax=Paeniglutamicibacter sp. R2-26 TaxID=3144417 RepID=UPI003EE76875